MSEESERSRAEVAVTALEADRERQRRKAVRWAAERFAVLALAVGEEIAREAWKLAPPTRRRGYRVTDEKARRDRIVVLTDRVNRDLGLSSEESAARIMEQFGIGNDPHDTRRTLDRLIARSRKTPIGQ